jgi:hypothetical protein
MGDEFGTPENQEDIFENAFRAGLSFPGNGYFLECRSKTEVFLFSNIANVRYSVLEISLRVRHVWVYMTD